MQVSNAVLTLDLATRGGELRSIRTADGAEWLWQGDPAWWGGRSPLLFPVVGKSPKDTVSIGGKRYPMAPHGVARVSEFRLADAGPGFARLVLEATDETRASYPFDFRLDATYALEGNTIRTEAKVTNRDDGPMPMQFGFHPGFCWPLPGSEGMPHAVSLGNGGTPALYRLDADKLLSRATTASPFAAGRLIPDRSGFQDDAMIFLDGAGTKVSFFAEGGGRIDMVTDNLPNFALWQKPGAPFLCLEPWHGTAPFNDGGDALETRNGALHLPPGESTSFRMDITITAA
ncbi:MAG: aldose 1-epimerase family protein [Devosia sp.]